MDAADPIWPLLVLAAIQLAGALMCVRPLPFIRDCLVDVDFPPRFWWLLTPIKLAAAAGLVLGVWVPEIGLAACVGLIVYFVIAITMHVRARDFGSNLFVNATGMLVLSVGATYLCFVALARPQPAGTTSV